MFFFVFGLPGEFTAWCERVVLALARRGGSAVGVLHADTLEEVALRALEAGLSHAVVSSRQPGGKLRTTVAELGRNFIVALDDPHTVLAELTLERGIDLPSAVQQLASSSAALARFADLAGALTLYSDRDGGRMIDTVAAIAGHLGFGAGADLAEIARDVGDPAAASGHYDIVAWWNGLDEAERQLALGALVPFVDAAGDGRPLSIAWGRELFFSGDRPDERLTDAVNITGRARCLLQGPHIALPPGSWSLSLTAAFLQGAAEHEFAVEVLADAPLASGTMVPQQGNGEVALAFTLAPETEKPLTIRISSQRAAFDGAITLVDARLEQSPVMDEDTAV